MNVNPQQTLISIGRVMKTGTVNFFRNWWLSTAATAIMLITLLLITTTVIFNRALNDTLVENSKDLTISVYIEDDITDDQQDELRQALEEDPNIAQLNFISKQDAQQLYVQKNQGDELLLDAIGIVGNQFPASYEAQLVDLTQNESFVETVNEKRFDDVVESYDQGRIETVNSIGDIQKNIIRGGVIAGVVFTAVSILIIFNTIRMAIFTRRDEIQMMKLIGATNNYIRGPFIFESSLYGVIAGSVTLVLLWFTLPEIEKLSSSKIIFTPTVELVTNNILLVALAVIGFGIIIGVISSLLAMTRYLRLR